MKQLIVAALLTASFTLQAQPRVLDYRIFQSPVKHQGDRNTCTGFAIAACLETFAGVPSDVSEQHIYAGLKMLEYGQTDPIDQGGRINLYASTLMRYGFLHESQMPYNKAQLEFSPGDHNLVQVIRESQTGPVSMLINLNRVKAYIDSADCEVAEFDAGLSEASIKQLLLQGVKAIGIGYYVNAYWFEWERKKNLLITPDSVGGFLDSARNISTFDKLYQQYGDSVFTQINDVFKPDGLKPWRYSSSKSAQGHAITIVGYNDKGFIIKNSWGRSWGDNGYATVSYAYHRLFAKRMIAIKRVRFTQPRTNQPVNSLTDIRLKLVPQGEANGISFSLFNLEEKSNPVMSSVTYKLYRIQNNKKTLLDSRTVLKDLYDRAPECFEAILLKGRPKAEDITENGAADLQLELTIYSPGAGKPQQRTYNDLRLVNSEYKHTVR